MAVMSSSSSVSSFSATAAVLPVDRTSDFESLFRQHQSQQSKQQSSCASSTPKPITPISHDAFTIESMSLLTSLRSTELSLRRSSRRYLDFSHRGLSDAERDALDIAAQTALDTASTRLEALTTAAKKLRTSATRRAHELGVAAALADATREVTSRHAALRVARMEEERRREVAERERERGMGEVSEVVKRELMEGGGNGNRNVEIVEEVRKMEMELKKENALLLGELIARRESVKQSRSTAMEIAQMNALFGNKVLEQAREIGGLYESAVEATDFVERGNLELRKMTKQRNLMKYSLAGFILTLTVVLLFMDFVASRRFLFLF